MVTSPLLSVTVTVGVYSPSSTPLSFRSSVTVLSSTTKSTVHSHSVVVLSLLLKSDITVAITPWLASVRVAVLLTPPISTVTTGTSVPS